MKKCISFLIILLICFNSIFINYSFANDVKATLGKEETINVDFQGKQEVIANYNELYGIQPLENETILSKETKSNKQFLKYFAVFIKFKDNNNNNHIDDPICVENAKKIFNSDELFDMDTVNGIIKVPSFKKYYETQSYGKLSITTELFPRVKDNVVSYETEQPIGYYLKHNDKNPIGYKSADEALQRETELINKAVKFVSKQIEDAGIKEDQIDTKGNGIVDAISFYIEGQKNLPNSIAWGDLLWSHKLDNRGITETILGKQVIPYNLIYVEDYTQSAGVFSLNRGTYGTIIHEFGHTLGYMDLYRHNTPENKPVGFYDIMGNSIGSNPQNLLTYFTSEYRLDTNWHQPLEIINKTTNNITLYKPEFKDDNEKRAIKVQQYAGSDEYFIIEYHEKQNTYKDYSADSSGIIVYRINEKRKNNGNTYGGNHGEDDHVFVFRPNELVLGQGKGNLTEATLNNTRNILGKELGKNNDVFDNKTIYYSDGSNSGIVVEVISQTDKSVTFNITFPNIQGEGSKEKPYLIYDVNNFLYLMKTETKNKYYKLMNDLDFATIKNYPKIDFKGNLNGNNKTLKNVSALGTGIFNNVGDYTISSIIENLNIENINVNPENGESLGGFAVTIQNTIVRNIHLKSGSVKNIQSLQGNNLSCTGGFVGNIYNDATIDNCSTSLNVSSEKNVGGFVGINMNAIIKNSYANGKISGNSNVGGFIGIQCISDSYYNVPNNVYFDYSKTKISKSVGGYADGLLHDLKVLPENDLGKGIVGISVPEEVNINKVGEANYYVTTNPNTNLSFLISSSDSTIVRYTNNKIQGLKNGVARIYVDLKVGTQTMRMQSKVNVINSSEVSETELLKHFGLYKKDGYVVGFKLGSNVSNVKQMLSSYPNVTLSSFKDAYGNEISNGTVSTNMKFTLTFNQKQYNYVVVVKGDVNGDGLIYATDYVKIKNHIMGKTKLEGAYLKAADINNDNNIYATDYVRIKNYIMGKGTIEQKY